MSKPMAPPPVRSAPNDELAALAGEFLVFADQECSDEPLYEALCRLLAQRPPALRWLLAAPAPQRRPNLLRAALHQRVQAGQAPALAAYCRSTGGTRAPDAQLAEALDRTLADEAPALQQLCATRSTQTNEVGRSALLWPALAELARRCGGRPLALLDFGCSAGLNLGLDRFHMRYLLPSDPAGGVARSWQAGAPAGQAALQLDCLLLGSATPTGARPAGLPPTETPAWRIATRCGIDPEPVLPHDEAGLRWLRACLWPSDAPRLARFDAALALLRREGHVIRRETDGAAAIARWLDGLPPAVQPVVVNSWVLTYMAPEALRSHIHQLKALVRERGLAWLSGEGPWLRLGAAEPPALDLATVAPHPLKPSAAAWSQGTLWWLVQPGQDQPELLARSHPHGRWLQWLGSAG
jgi:hypothetical protein